MAKSRRGSKPRTQLPEMSRDAEVRTAGTTRWSIQRAALTGASCGALVGLARLFIIPELGYPAAYYVGAVLGWAVVGALLGILIAAVKNASGR